VRIPGFNCEFIDTRSSIIRVLLLGIVPASLLIDVKRCVFIITLWFLDTVCKWFIISFYEENTRFIMSFDCKFQFISNNCGHFITVRVLRFSCEYWFQIDWLFRCSNSIDVVHPSFRICLQFFEVITLSQMIFFELIIDVPLSCSCQVSSLSSFCKACTESSKDAKFVAHLFF